MFNVTRQSLHKWMTGENCPSTENFLRILSLGNIYEIKKIENASQYSNISKLKVVPESLIKTMESNREYFIEKEFVPNDSCFFLSIESDFIESMINQHYLQNILLLIDPTRMPQKNNIVIALDKNKNPIIRLYGGDISMPLLTPVNPKYAQIPAMTVPVSDCEIIGVAIRIVYESVSLV